MAIAKCLVTCLVVVRMKHYKTDYFQLQEEAPMLAKLQEEIPIPPKPFFSEEQIHYFRLDLKMGTILFLTKIMLLGLISSS